MARERDSSESAALRSAERSSIIALHTQQQLDLARSILEASEGVQRAALIEAQHISLARLTQAILDDDHLRRTSLAAAMAADRIAFIRRQNEELAITMRQHAEAALRVPSIVLPEGVNPSVLQLPSSGIADVWRKVGGFIAESMLAARAKLSNG